MDQSFLGLDKKLHRKLAVNLFNYTWELIDKPIRTDIENEEMINAAHASRFHWGIVGTELNFARGEWLISRAYALLGRHEPSRYHAEKSLKLCLDNNLGDFDTGFAYEAMARSYCVGGDNGKRDEYMAQAVIHAERVRDRKDRTWLLDNVGTVPTLTLPEWGAEETE